MHSNGNCANLWRVTFALTGLKQKENAINQTINQGFKIVMVEMAIIYLQFIEMFPLLTSEGSY